MGYVIIPLIISLSYFVYKAIPFFKAPKEIQSIPVIPFFKIIRSTLLGQSFDEKYEQVYRPVLEKMGYARYWVNGNWEIMVSDPQQTRYILDNADTFLKRSPTIEEYEKKMLISKFFGFENVLASDGHEWRRHRRTINPALKKSWSNELFADCTLELIEKLDEFDHEPIEASPFFQRLTLDALGRGLFGYDFEAVKKGENSYYLKVYNEVMLAVYSPLYFLFPFLEEIIPSRKYYHKRNTEFSDFIADIIKERKTELQNGEDKIDLLSSITKASMDEIDSTLKLTDDEVLNDIKAFFFAGHNTTANTLIATFYFLAKYKDIQEEARREVLDVLGDKGTIVTPTTDDLKSMPYINCFIKESMRFMSTVTQTRRYCSTTTILGGGLVIPGGTSVALDMWSIHHDPNLFPNPNIFDPERFRDLRGSPGRAWMAFGSGSRMCAGINFYLIEQRVVMTMLLQRYTIRFGPNSHSLDKPMLKQSQLTHPLDVDLVFVPR